MTTWTDELKEQAIADYVGRNPTPETSTEILTEIANSMGFTPNGVRAILVRAEKYVKKTPESKPKASGNGSKRVSKADSINKLKEVIEKAGGEVDEEILSKLTGKAALYFAETITTIVGE